jgi:hypothetical protein
VNFILFVNATVTHFRPKRDAESRFPVHELSLRHPKIGRELGMADGDERADAQRQLPVRRARLTAADACFCRELREKQRRMAELKQHVRHTQWLALLPLPCSPFSP